MSGPRRIRAFTCRRLFEELLDLTRETQGAGMRAPGVDVLVPQQAPGVGDDGVRNARVVDDRAADLPVVEARGDADALSQ